MKPLEHSATGHPVTVIQPDRLTIIQALGDDAGVSKREAAAMLCKGLATVDR